MLLLGERLKAPEAAEIGLVDDACANPEATLAAARELAGRLAEMPAVPAGAKVVPGGPQNPLASNPSGDQQAHARPAAGPQPLEEGQRMASMAKRGIHRHLALAG